MTDKQLPVSSFQLPAPNIILTGFMGTGKTTVGKEVAARLGRRFVDLDDLIVERAGKSIPDIFAQDGEPAFRDLESAVCQELREPAGLVIATGGGAVIDPANREALSAGGVIICLEAAAEVIVARLAGGNGRPLLSGPDRGQRIADLLAQRADAYKPLPHHLDTSKLSIAAIAERVMGIAARLPEGGHRLIVDFGLRISDYPHSDSRSAIRSPQSEIGSYDVLIADGLLAQAGQRLVAAGLRPGRCAVVTNPTVGAHYAKTLAGALAAAGFEPVIFEAPDGEAYKTLVTVGHLYTQFAEARLARGEPVIALGGGVIGDMAGFVAATWLRGVPFVQSPTSLLAMVDASGGGKVAVDLPAGKNLVGAFKQPAVVLIDPATLKTLPGAEFRAGLAEILKAAIIGDPALFEQLAGNGPVSLVGMIADAVRVKARIVERDPFEAGDRAWLNLGHTFGHALELLSDFTLRHGDAVALGTVAAAEMSAVLGHCDRTLPVRVRSVAGRLGLPTSHAFDPSAALTAMATDKKRRGRRLRFVLPVRVGEVALVEDVPEAAIKAAFESIQSKERTDPRSCA
ncbi:MAG: 3-dehydroquinate synthase [Chloroflexi bacterium HGW-Chloroflexi-1]|nr:MAG: 3-dehydroquinate synthase [Chloroflexi bacterium HGW-Chloroflexi-1]